MYGLVGRHKFTAELVNGKSIIVKNEKGEKIKVEFAGTVDRFTAYAYIRGIGFIGGWTCGIGPTPIRKKAPQWKDLVDSINNGIVYPDMNMLPPSFGRPYKEQTQARQEIYRGI